MKLNRTLLSLGLSASLLVGYASASFADDATYFINHKGYLLSVKNSNRQPYVVYTNGKGMQYVLRTNGQVSHGFIARTGKNQLTEYATPAQKKLIKVMKIKRTGSKFVLSVRYADHHMDGFTVYALPKGSLQRFVRR